jgi:hypothetical protein
MSFCTIELLIHASQFDLHNKIFKIFIFRFFVLFFGYLKDGIFSIDTFLILDLICQRTKRIVEHLLNANN